MWICCWKIREEEQEDRAAKAAEKEREIAMKLQEQKEEQAYARENIMKVNNNIIWFLVWFFSEICLFWLELHGERVIHTGTAWLRTLPERARNRES